MANQNGPNNQSNPSKNPSAPGASKNAADFQRSGGNQVGGDKTMNKPNQGDSQRRDPSTSGNNAKSTKDPSYTVSQNPQKN